MIAGTDGAVEKIIINDGEELVEEAKDTENRLPLSMIPRIRFPLTTVSSL